MAWVLWDWFEVCTSMTQPHAMQAGISEHFRPQIADGFELTTDYAVSHLSNRVWLSGDCPVIGARSRYLLSHWMPLMCWATVRL